MIREGDTVIVRMHDDESSHMLHVRGEQKLFKKRLVVDSLIGAPYGAIFQIDGMALTRVLDDQQGLDEVEAAVGVEGEEASAESGKAKVRKGDNSNYNDTNTSQKMTIAQIEKLKDAGVSGNEIIQSLIANRYVPSVPSIPRRMQFVSLFCR